MFSVDDYIVYGTTGVCKVVQIGPMKMSGVSGDRIYYTLAPVYSKGSTIFTPADNDKVIMRPVLTRDEAEKLIDEIQELDTLWVPDEKKREDIYKQSIRTCECTEWIKIIKALYLRKADRIAEGKKVTVNDTKYLHLAEERLYGELAISLDMQKDEVEDYITKRIEEMEVEKQL